MNAPVAPKTAVVIRAVSYLGASFLMKMLLLTRPIKFASGTPTEVIVIRLFSSAMLLLKFSVSKWSCGILFQRAGKEAYLYHVLRMTEGALVPQHIMKVAK